MKFFIFFIGIIFLNSCNKCKEPDCNKIVPEEPKVRLTFSMKYGDKDLKINEFYSTESKDTFRTTQLKFYISNIRLTQKNGTEYIEPESYHLFSLENPDKKSIIIKGVPPGEYEKISFALGIDSIRNHSGDQVGDLDPANGMFWTWSDGYLFLRYEGVLKKTPPKGLIVHIGEDAYYTPYTIAFSSPIKIEKNTEFTIPLKFNLYNLFNYPNVVAVDSLSHGFPGNVLKNLPYLISLN